MTANLRSEQMWQAQIMPLYHRQLTVLTEMTRSNSSTFTLRLFSPLGFPWADWGFTPLCIGPFFPEICFVLPFMFWLGDPQKPIIDDGKTAESGRFLLSELDSEAVPARRGERFQFLNQRVSLDMKTRTENTHSRISVDFFSARVFLLKPISTMKLWRNPSWVLLPQSHMIIKGVAFVVGASLVLFRLAGRIHQDTWQWRPFSER